MVAFYNPADQELYKKYQYLPQEQYRLGLNVPINNVPINTEAEEINASFGIPNTEAFMASGDGNNFRGSYNQGDFQPYTARPSGSFVTNRTDYGSRGYLPGTEPEETFMDTAGGLIRKGIGFAIPGGNFLMSMADNFSRENRLNAQDNAFIDMQLANQEQNIHGFGNLTNQDRYGYNIDSLTGNYANVVADRVAIANQRLKDNKELRPIDQYYLEKQKEEDDVKNQIDFNNFIRQRTAANKIREAEKLGIKLAPDGTQIHGTPPSGGGGGGDGTYGVGSDGQKSYDSGQGFGIDATTGGPVSNRTGRGRDDYSKGGLATMFTRRR